MIKKEQYEINNLILSSVIYLQKAVINEQAYLCVKHLPQRVFISYLVYEYFIK